MKNYDKWKSDTPDNHVKPSGKWCNECGYEIMVGEDYLDTDNGYFHDNSYSCIGEYAISYFNSILKTAE